ncbi:GIY-YIG nuclease family protein [Sinorhizobium meliloti]|uniref:GIY-YIG nuclease family protein n=1 Tax=Rhizobium meliloti TaxID=382 RepID=UPI001F15C84F|nr:GIY-YIG nuclease family protein [Sinorhizobium meliloti]
MNTAYSFLRASAFFEITPCFMACLLSWAAIANRPGLLHLSPQAGIHNVLSFGNLLDLVGIERSAVRLLRHQDNRYTGYHSPYTLWRDHRDRFEAYQETQSINDEARLRAPYWASFVGVPGRETLFVGLYSAELVGVLSADRAHPVTGGIEEAGTCHLYKLELRSELAEFAGRLWVDWGNGYRSWIQRGDSGAKPVVEIRRNLGEPPFPGFQALILNLSEIESIPATWAAALSATRGIYLLTCPKTREQYVGMASGFDGFMGRWREYFATGHGGNVGLKSRDPSDYQVSILETVGTCAAAADLIALEVRWKHKFQSRQMGLNRN